MLTNIATIAGTYLAQENVLYTDTTQHDFDLLRLSLLAMCSAMCLMLSGWQISET